jgi:hypothetical protein
MARRMMGIGTPADTVFPDPPTADMVSLSVTTGGTAGGTTVRLNMTFAPVGPTITVDGTPCAVTNASYGEAGWYEFATPAHAAAAVLVYVDTTYGLSGPLTFTYTGATLTAGTATAVRGDTIVSLSATAPTGGTSPYTYQWYRSTTNGQKGSSLGASFQTLIETDTGLTNGTTYYYTLDATDSAGSPATVSYTQKSATPAAATGTLARGPGANQPVGHTLLFQLNTVAHDQDSFVQPDGTGGNTNGDTLNGATTYTAKWQDGAHAQFNKADPAGEISWPCMEMVWQVGDAVDGASCLATLSLGAMREVYLRELYWVEDDFQFHASGDLKGLRFYQGGNSIIHCHNRTGTSVSPTAKWQYRMEPNRGCREKWQSTLASGDQPGKGFWIELETVYRAESAVGVLDGYFQAWINGTPVTWADLGTPGAATPNALNWFDAAPLNFNRLHITHYRGGTNGTAITTESVLRVAEVVVSGKTT